MKKSVFALLLAACMLLALLGGCRSRVLPAPEGADRVIYEELPQEELSQEPQPEDPPPPEEPESPPEPPEDESPPPEEEAPPEPLPPEPADDDPPAQPTETQPDIPAQTGAIGAETFVREIVTGVTVTYDSNGGDSGTVKVSVTPGQPYGVQPEAVWRGHSFLGWFTEKGGGSPVTYQTEVTAQQDHTLFAHWQEKGTCTVTLDGNGGRVKSRESRVELSEGDRYGTLATPLREGYDFLGWFTEAEGGEAVTEESVFSGDADQTLFAHWEYDPVAFWTFTLKNKTQQVYLCQQVSIYFEESPGVTRQSVGLISSTGSLNIAENRSDPNVSDDWVLAKKPGVVMVLTSGLSASTQAEVQARFPQQKIILVTEAALGSGSAGLYARIALAKELYPDWYEDVDLGTVASELGVTSIPIYF